MPIRLLTRYPVRIVLREYFYKTPQIARRACEFHQQRGYRDAHADQDWLEAEHEIRKDQMNRRRSRQRLPVPQLY